MPEQTPPSADSAPAPARTAEQQAAVIEQAAERVFIAHCARKTQSNKPLTRQELSRLNAIKNQSAPAPNFVQNQVELADVLDVSRKTIQRALEKEGNPGAQPDGRYDVKAWREFLALTNEHLADGDVPTIKSERARNLMLKNDKLEFELAVLRRDYRSAEEVERETGEMIAEARKVLNSGPSSLAPQVVGVSIAEAEKLISQWIFDALSQLHNDPLGHERDTSRATIINEQPG